MSEKKALFYADEKIKENAHGDQLISFDKGKLDITKEGAAHLAQLGTERDCNLVFIFGNARSGKSFMMNCLSGVRGLFRVVNSSTPCTRGVDISSHIASWETLATHAGIDPSTFAAVEEKEPPKKKGGLGGLFSRAKDAIIKKRKPPLVGFVDVEGQGAEDGTYDTMLALPLLMTSKVVLFNHKGAPTVSDMLSKLGVLARAAEYIDLGDEKAPQEDDKEDVDSPSKEAQSPQSPPDKEVKNGASSGQGPKKFGHLHVLFRDFSFNSDKEAVYNQLMQKEKVVKRVPSAKDKAKPAGLDPSQAAKERNDIRDLLLRNFESINVWLFKQPASADQLIAHNELPPDLIDPDFAMTVHELFSTVVEQMKNPTYFNGAPLTGPRHVSLLAQITRSLNEGGVINVPSVFHAMEKETVDRVTEECLKIFSKAVQKLEDELPLPNKVLLEKSKVLNDQLFERWETELSECNLEEELKLKKKVLIETATRIITDLEKANANATLQKVKKVIMAEVTKMRTIFERFCEKNIPMEDGKALEGKFKELKNESRDEIKKQLQDLPQALQLPEFQVVLLEQEEILQEFLTLQTIKNESSLKDRRIEKMHEEAIRRQEQLIEQNKKLEKFLKEEKSNTQTMERELDGLRKTKEDQDRRAKEVADQLAKQNEELERLRKQRKRCTIL